MEGTWVVPWVRRVRRRVGVEGEWLAEGDGARRGGGQKRESRRERTERLAAEAREFWREVRREEKADWRMAMEELEAGLKAWVPGAGWGHPPLCPMAAAAFATVNDFEIAPTSPSTGALELSNGGQ